MPRQPKFCHTTCFLGANGKTLYPSGHENARNLYARRRQPRSEDALEAIENYDEFFGDAAPPDGDNQPPEHSSQTEASRPDGFVVLNELPGPPEDDPTKKEAEKVSKKEEAHATKKK